MRIRGIKTIPGCCCEKCEKHPRKCCCCIPKALCLTFSQYGQDDCSGEVYWSEDDQRFSGTVCGHDILFYLDRVGEDCYLKLRSTSLGFPDGYEYEWQIGYDIACRTMSGSVEAGYETLTFSPVVYATPTLCKNCHCPPECICVTLTEVVDGETVTCVGKLCWDYAQHAYVGTVTCDDYAETVREISIRLAPKSEFYGDTDDCVAVLSIPSLYIEDEWVELPDCETTDFGGTFEIAGPGPYDSTTVTFAYAECNSICASTAPCDSCPQGLPRRLYATIVAVDNPGVQTCWDGTVIQLDWANTGLGGAFWSGTVRCGGCTSDGGVPCPDPDPASQCSFVIQLNCLGVDEPELLQLLFVNTGGGGTYINANPGATCAPYAEFGPYANGSCVDRAIGAMEDQPTFNIVVTA